MSSRSTARWLCNPTATLEVRYVSNCVSRAVLFAVSEPKMLSNAILPDKELHFNRKCQSKHTVDRLNPQPATSPTLDRFTSKVSGGQSSFLRPGRTTTCFRRFAPVGATWIDAS